MLDRKRPSAVMLIRPRNLRLRRHRKSRPRSKLQSSRIKRCSAAAWAPPADLPGLAVPAESAALEYRPAVSEVAAESAELGRSVEWAGSEELAESEASAGLVELAGSAGSAVS